MQVQTQSPQFPKIIYETKNIASLILKKLVKRNPTNKYTMARVTAGWQVVPITQCPPFMPPAKPLPVKPVRKPEPVVGETVMVEVKFVQETKAYFEIEHEKRWLHKSHVISSEIVNDILRFTTTPKSVNQLGLTHLVMET